MDENHQTQTQMQEPVFSAGGMVAPAFSARAAQHLSLESASPTPQPSSSYGQLADEYPTRSVPPPPPPRMAAPALAATAPEAPPRPVPTDELGPQVGFRAAPATDARGSSEENGSVDVPPARRPPPPPPRRPAVETAAVSQLSEAPEHDSKPPPPPPRKSPPLSAARSEPARVPQPPVVAQPSESEPPSAPPPPPPPPPAVQQSEPASPPPRQPPQPPPRPHQPKSASPPPRQSPQPPPRPHQPKSASPPPRQSPHPPALPVFQQPRAASPPPGQPPAPPQPMAASPPPNRPSARPQPRAASPPPPRQPPQPPSPPPMFQQIATSPPPPRHQPPPVFQQKAASPPPPQPPRQPGGGLDTAFGDVVEPTVASGEDSEYNAKNHIGSVSMWKKGFRQGIRGSKSAGGAPQYGMALPGMHDDVIEEDVFPVHPTKPPVKTDNVFSPVATAGFGGFPSSVPTTKSQPTLAPRVSASAATPPQPAQATKARPAPKQHPVMASRAAGSRSAPAAPPHKKKAGVDWNDADYKLVDFDNMMISRPAGPQHPSTKVPVKTLNDIARLQPARGPEISAFASPPPNVVYQPSPQQPYPHPQAHPQAQTHPHPQAQAGGVMMPPAGMVPGQQYVVQQPGMQPQVVMVPPGAVPPGRGVVYAPSPQYAAYGQLPPQHYQQGPRP